MRKVDNLVGPDKTNKLEILIYNNRHRLHAENTVYNHDFCKNIINDIIYNEKAHIVAVFKDYLIYDDTSEFLKRFYKHQESKSRLNKIFEFYDSYSKIYPNYTVMKEAKYVYKNIQKKQKMIDNIHRKYSKGKSERLDQSIPDEKIFVTDVYDSIMNLTLCTVKFDESKVINPPSDQIKDKIYKKELNLSIRIDESNHTFEGLIDNIGKAEESSFNMLKKKPNLKKQPASTKEGVHINNQVKGTNKNHQLNINKFNKKTELLKESTKKKLDFSPNIKMNNKGKQYTNAMKQPSPISKAVFKSIQFNDKLNINSLLDSVNQQPNVLYRKESFLTKNSIVEDKKLPETERELKNEISHNFMLSIPKNALNNHIYNNFNIINNFHQGDGMINNQETPYSRINIISELSPKINSARVIQKFEIKKEDNNKKLNEVNKIKNINTSHSVNLNNYVKEDKNHNIVRLRKNHTKSNINKQNEGRNNPTNNSILKSSLLKNNSSQLNNPSNSKTNLKLNTIKAPSYINDNNSISLTKRDKMVSLTARQFIQEDSSNVKVIQGKNSDEVSSSQNLCNNFSMNYKHLNQINSSRLTKNSISIGKSNKTNSISNKTSDKKKEFSSTKLIKRNYSETYKAFNQSKGGEAFNVNIEKSKPNIYLKKKSQKNFSIENKSESTSISKVRVNSGKTTTLSPKKSVKTIANKPSSFRPLEHTRKDLNTKTLNQVKSLSSFQTVSVSSHNFTKSNSSRVKMRIDESKKNSIIYLK